MSAPRPTVTHAYLFPNGMVAAIGPDGQQVPEYQGRSEEVLPKLRANFPDLVVHGAESTPVQDTWFTDRALPVMAMSGDVESDRVIKLHFRRRVTDADRKALCDALNLHQAAVSGKALEHSHDLGWVVGNGDRTKWRVWRSGLPVWTDNPIEATRYARREDAEAVHAEDQDAWRVMPFAETQPIKHEWAVYNGWWCCAKCGVIKNDRNADRNCRGPVRVELREAAAPDEPYRAVLIRLSNAEDALFRALQSKEGQQDG